MATKSTDNEILGNFNDLLSERYLAYSLSTIISRSLPDVRDGLKPVHRRILFAMSQLKLDPTSSFKKCARVIGDVIGKYHPHGDAAVYESLVRLAQDFALRYPLIHGQGNFGSIDGDNAAAMRYTESKLTKMATYMLDELDEETVEFRLTYDSQEEEPTVLPAAFPNLLANGTEGIAVGMATSIPPHNLDELCEALLVMIKNPEITTRELIEIIPGPDFPTGGSIIKDSTSILNAYETGKGFVTLRAKWEKEELSHGLYQIIITEIPYQVQKSKLIIKIADLLREKKLPLLSDVRDESSENIRIIIEPKSKSVDPEILMESLFKLSDLQVNIYFNMNVITKDTIPKLMGLKDLLLAFLDHRKVVVTNRSQCRLNKINNRLEIIEGYLIVYLNLDEVIKIIRESDEAKKDLMERFVLSDNQAETILNMRLRSLRKLEEFELNKEKKKLYQEKEDLEGILQSDQKLWKIISAELKEIQKDYSKKTEIGKRKTNLLEKLDIKSDFKLEDFTEKEPITIICSEMGWIKAMKAHNVDLNEIKYKDGDKERFILQASTHDKLLIFTEKGKFYTIGCEKINRARGNGDPIRSIIDIEDSDKIIDMFIYVASNKYLLVSKEGKGFIVNSEDLLAYLKTGKQILSCSEKDKAYLCRLMKGDLVAIIGENRKMLIFPLDEIPHMKKGQGVKLQKYQNSNVLDIKLFSKEEGLSWKVGEKVKTQKDLRGWIDRRATSGKLPPTGFPRTGLFNWY
jgi:topoisomerase-4 subunit A